MMPATDSRDLGEALSRLADVDREIQRCASSEETADRGLDPLRRRLEQLSLAITSRRCATGATDSVDEVGCCRYRELQEELQEKTAIAHSKKRLAQRERRMLEIRRSHIMAAIPHEILAAYRGLVRQTA
jgi:hypothetical protein